MSILQIANLKMADSELRLAQSLTQTTVNPFDPEPADNSVEMSGNESYAMDALTRDVILGVNMYGLPVIILLGIVGNTVSFVVFLTSQLRHQSSSVYLAFLNLSDCLFLVCLLLSQLEWYGVYVMRVRGLCQVVVYLSYISAFLSVWTVVSFTVERFIVVYFPLKRLAHCTKRKALWVAFSLLLISLLLYSFSLWTNRVQIHPTRGHLQCMVVKEFAPLVHGLSMADTFLTMLAPSVIIIVLNILIVMGVWRFIRQRGTLQEGYTTRSVAPPSGIDETYPMTTVTEMNNTSPCIVRTPTPAKGRTRNSKESIDRQRHQCRTQAVQLKTTRNLLIISSLFVILNLPSHAFRVWAALNPQGDTPSETLLLWQLVLQFLYYLNFSSNLVMYCACMKTFRLEVVAMVTRGGRSLSACAMSSCGNIRRIVCVQCSKHRL